MHVFPPQDHLSFLKCQPTLQNYEVHEFHPMHFENFPTVEIFILEPIEPCPILDDTTITDLLLPTQDPIVYCQYNIEQFSTTRLNGLGPVEFE